jgi:ABC-type nitrate/sulfonate/bicarbonate transport system substrate-binding protein
LGFSEIIKHMIAIRESLWHEQPELKEKLQAAFRASFAYSEEHLEQIADEFVKNYPGDKQALLASARYPKIEFTLTETEQRLADAEMDMMVEVGWIPHKAAVQSLFAI